MLELDADVSSEALCRQRPSAIARSEPQGPLTLSADEIVSALRPDGSVESIVATGNVHGTRNTPVGGDGIDAGRVQVDLATRDNLPRLLTASNGVTLTSTSASFNGGTRRVESDALEIHFSSDSRPGQNIRGKREHARSGARRMAKRGPGERQARSAIDANGRQADESEIRRAEPTAAAG